MQHKYGTFTDTQIAGAKKKMHDMIFWLLLYKDPKLGSQYEHVNFERYFTFLMKQFDGLSSLLGNPKEMVQLLSILEAANLEVHAQSFNFSVYRKLVLDAQSVVDTIGGDLDELR